MALIHAVFDESVEFKVNTGFSAFLFSWHEFRLLEGILYDLCPLDSLTLRGFPEHLEPLFG
jgi:hypothetical protein